MWPSRVGMVAEVVFVWQSVSEIDSYKENNELLQGSEVLEQEEEGKFKI